MPSPNFDVRNPTGIELSQEQQDQVFRTGYWEHAVRYGTQYYVAGRFAAASGFTPVLANLLHHAVELFLKACLAFDDPADRIRQYGSSKTGYRHNLPLLWAEFKKRNAAAVRPEFERIIEALHKFEVIRYPESLINDGATISIDIFAGVGHLQDGHEEEQTSYRLSLPEVDEMMGLLLVSARCNRELVLAEVNDERRRRYYDTLLPSLFGQV